MVDDRQTPIRTILPVTSDSDLEEGSARPRIRGVQVGGAVLAVTLLVVGLIAAGGVGRGGIATAIARPHVSDGLLVLASNDTDDDTMPDGEVPKKATKSKKKCSWGKENCNETKCCNNPGMLCYEQAQWYAQCRETCKKDVPDPGHWDNQPWTCKELGQRSAGSPKCADLGSDCRAAGCCSQINTQCFEKNEDWATCKSECQEGAPDLTDVNGDPWTCKKLGPWTEGASPWVSGFCSKEGEDCSHTKCCASPGATCYKQSDYWAQCKYWCNPGKDPARPWEPDWSCEPIGYQTPGTGGVVEYKVGAWVEEKCVEAAQDCKDAKCCKGMNMQCYEKNKDWATCLPECTQGAHADDKNETWSCRVLGPRTNSGLATKGAPSLFCWSLFQTKLWDGGASYEMDIMQLQLKQGAGIFQCDDWALLSTDDETTLGKFEGKEARTKKVPKAEVTQSVDGTAGNAQLFVNCWKVILEDGRWRHHAWVVKVDPDAVIIPERIRNHLRPHVLENVYVVNCNKFPGSPNFPMMYGSVEIYSFRAIDTYELNQGLCFSDMGMMIPKWGEDYWMTHCLDHIGVGRIEDFASVGDNVCTGGSCADQYFAAFHPFKSAAAWQNCWDMAHGKVPPPQQPQWR